MRVLPELATLGGLVRAGGLFGARLVEVLNELTDVLVA